MTNESDEQDAAERIDALIERTAASLRSVGDDRPEIVAVFEQFLDEGMSLVYSPSAMWGYLDTVLRRAGFDGQQQDRLYRIFSTVTNRRFQGGRPYPPDWPWHETEET